MENIATKNEMTSPIFRTIGEVASEIGIPPHVLRFWESKFDIIKPHKRKGGHRYYKPADIQAIKDIKHLLYDEGFTIKGAQKFLKDKNDTLDDDSQANLFENAFEKEEKANNDNFGDDADNIDNVQSQAKSDEVLKGILKQLYVIKENIENAKSE